MKVVIPSGDLASLRECVAKLYERQPDLTPERILVLTDGIYEQARAEPLTHKVWLRRNVEPFNWAKSVNIGLDWAAGDDLVVMDDNAILETKGGLDILAARAAESDVGVVGPAISICAPPQQLASAKEIDVPWIVGACFFISKKCKARFSEWPGYGYWEADFCRRVRREGLRTVVERRCHVEHQPSKIYKERAMNDQDLMTNRAAFYRAWGDTDIWKMEAINAVGS